MKIVGKSKAIKKVKQLVKSYAGYDYPILIQGETGVGKELVAKNIHYLSPRSRFNYVILNSANIQFQLMESEIFGYRKGAFTDATEDKKGIVEEARNGTLLFDEIVELPPNVQAKMLRLLDGHEVRRLGDVKEEKINIRFLFSTNCNLLKEMEKGSFRRDFYHRISTFVINIPPLRERKEDIPLLVEYILSCETLKSGTVYRLSNGALSLLIKYEYPGNIRELQNILRRSIALSGQGDISEKNLSKAFYYCSLGPFSSKHELPVELSGEQTFWNTIYRHFLNRDLNRKEVKQILVDALQKTQGSYKKLLPLFNLRENEYKKFMDFIRTHRLIKG